MATPIYDLTPGMVLDAINRDNGTAIKAEHVKFTTPVPSTVNWMAQQGGGNTAIRLITLPGSGLTGTTLITYDRVEVNMIATMVGHMISIPVGAVDTHSILAEFLNRYGIKLYVDDFENTPITWTGENGAFTLKAKADSVIFVGEAAFTTLQLPKTLDRLVSDPVLPTYEQDYFRTQNVQPTDMLFYNVDFTVKSTDMMNISAENYDPAKMEEIIVAVAPKVASALINPSINPAINPKLIDYRDLIVEYNGLNSGIPDTDKSYKYVMVLGFPEHPNWVGNLYLHYNDRSEIEGEI